MEKPNDDVNFDVLERKWRSFFRFLDVNDDKSVSEDDFRNIAERLISAYQVTGNRATDIRQALKGWWNVFKMQVGSARNIATEEEYVQAVKSLFIENRPVFLAHTKELADSMHDAIDLDGNGVISRAEYIRMFTTMGVQNTGYIGRVFDCLDMDNSGVLDRTEFRRAMVEFNFNDSMTDNKGYLFNFPQNNNSP